MGSLQGGGPLGRGEAEGGWLKRGAYPPSGYAALNVSSCTRSVRSLRGEYAGRSAAYPIASRHTGATVPAHRGSGRRAYRRTRRPSTYRDRAPSPQAARGRRRWSRPGCRRVSRPAPRSAPSCARDRRRTPGQPAPAPGSPVRVRRRPTTTGSPHAARQRSGTPEDCRRTAPCLPRSGFYRG